MTKHAVSDEGGRQKASTLKREASIHMQLGGAFGAAGAIVYQASFPTERATSPRTAITTSNKNTYKPTTKS